MTRELTIMYMGEDLEDLNELKEYILLRRFVEINNRKGLPRV